MPNALAEGVKPAGRFYMEHWRDGELLHTEHFDNLWTDVGKKFVLDTMLATAGTAPTAMHIGLKLTGTAVAADTMASHASWTEATVIAARGTLTFSASSGTGSVSRATSANTSFAITGGATIFGAFIVLNGTSTVSNTTGTLFSAGDFSGSRVVINGDTLTVGYTATLT
jgi:hypothetical protein